MSMAEGFKCPACAFRMDVIDSRSATVNEKPTVRRRRKCKNCNTRITTYEMAAEHDVEDLRFALGSVMASARAAQSALAILLDQYEPLLTRKDK